MAIKKDNREVEEINKDVALLKQKPEIDRKINFYKETMFAIEQMYKTIEERIERGYVLEKSTILGIITVRTKKILDSYEIGKLKVEKHELEAEVFAKQEFYRQWLERSKEWEVRFEQITLECNEHFETLLAKAKEIAEGGQIRLAQTINKFEKSEDIKDQKSKNDFYLYMRREVTNYLNNKK